MTTRGWLTDAEVVRLRAETPGAGAVAHLNNAGASLPPQAVVDRAVDHLRQEARIGGYEAADAVRDELEQVYHSIARLVGGAPHEIAVVENATRGWDMAFYALTAGLGDGDRILTTRAEYASNAIASLQVARRTGAQVEVVPDDDHGQASVDALREMLDERVRLLSVTHVPTQGGLVNPAAALGAVAREAGVPMLLDACQSAGQLDLDVGELGCVALSATSRKFLRGPRGVGFLWVDEAWIDRLEPPLLDLHAARWTAPDSYAVRADARRFENWETNVAAKLAFGTAVAYALDVGLPAIERRVVTLAADLRTRLEALPRVTIHDRGERRGAIVAFSVDGHDAGEVVQRLRRDGVNTSLVTRQSAQYDLPERDLERLVRASVHYYNDAGDLERLVAHLAALD